MIFVTLGSQKFQFNRILKEIDKLIEENAITEEVFAQIGNSDYVPKNFKYQNFINQEEFKTYISQCDIVITHGGTGAIITGVKAGKKVIAVPRLAEYNEHVNDHQIQIVKNFGDSNIVLPVYNMDDLKNAIKEIRNMTFSKYVSNNKEIIADMEKYIDSL